MIQRPLVATVMVGSIPRGGPIELFLVLASTCNGGIGFPFSLSHLSFIICLIPYKCKNSVLSASLNKTHPFLYVHFSGWAYLRNKQGKKRLLFVKTWQYNMQVFDKVIVFKYRTRKLEKQSNFS